MKEPLNSAAKVPHQKSSQMCADSRIWVRLWQVMYDWGIVQGIASFYSELLHYELFYVVLLSPPRYQLFLPTYFHSLFFQCHLQFLVRCSFCQAFCHCSSNLFPRPSVSPLNSLIFLAS